MKITIASAALAVFVCCSPAISQAAPTLTVNPNSDGSIYVCEGCNPVSEGSSVLAAFYIQGIVKFSSEAITGPVAQAFLTLNPYSLPLFGKNLEVYGYGTTLGQLDETDGNAGALLGTLVLPLDLGFGQDAFFDVTAFVNTVNAPFLAFNLRSPEGVDDFSSLESNYGHPSQLLITFAVPEPPLATLLLAALLAYVGFSLRRLTRIASIEWHPSASSNARIRGWQSARAILRLAVPLHPLQLNVRIRSMRTLGTR